MELNKLYFGFRKIQLREGYELKNLPEKYVLLNEILSNLEKEKNLERKLSYNKIIQQQNQP